MGGLPTASAGPTMEHDPTCVGNQMQSRYHMQSEDLNRSTPCYPCLIEALTQATPAGLQPTAEASTPPCTCLACGKQSASSYALKKHVTRAQQAQALATERVFTPARDAEPGQAKCSQESCSAGTRTWHTTLRIMHARSSTQIGSKHNPPMARRHIRHLVSQQLPERLCVRR